MPALDPPICDAVAQQRDACAERMGLARTAMWALTTVYLDARPGLLESEDALVAPASPALTHANRPP